MEVLASIEYNLLYLMQMRFFILYLYILLVFNFQGGFSKNFEKNYY